MNADFEWDARKAASNLKKHGVSFEQATIAFDDAFALIEQDDGEDYGEDRFTLIGRALDGILTVVYTERDGRNRIISAREADEYERRNYYRAAQEERR
jgi:uncharacterized DUF497 family protein